MTKKSRQNGWADGGYIGLSIALGAGFGVAFDNIPIGAIVGLIIGVILTAYASSKPD